MRFSDHILFQKKYYKLRNFRFMIMLTSEPGVVDGNTDVWILAVHEYLIFIHIAIWRENLLGFNGIFVFKEEISLQ